MHRCRKIGKIGGGADVPSEVADQRQYVNKYIVLCFYWNQGGKPPEAVRF